MDEQNELEKNSGSIATSNETNADDELTPKPSFLDFESYSSFFDAYSSQIKETVAASNKITLKQSDLDYMSTISSFKSFMNKQNDKILKLMSHAMKQQGIKRSNINSSKLDDEERMDLLIDVNDQIIEKIGIQLDEIQGLRKKTETEIKIGSASNLQTTSRNIPTSWNNNIGMVFNKQSNESVATTLNQTASSLAAKQSAATNDLNKKGSVVQKPQKLFKDKVDNSTLPFLPKIRQKPNALVPLSEIFSMLDDPSLEVNEQFFEENLELYLKLYNCLLNPYTYEIEQFNSDNLELDSNLDCEIGEPLPLEKFNYKFIDTLDDLVWLCDYLGKNNRARIREIVVDLEHHSYRSYLGFTCLMQISTRYDDFLIDSLKLRHEMFRLNEIFTDWTLTKILHGSDFDIEWLQKDFGLYIVNMFDTGQAARVLQYPHYSLSYLLQRYCGVNAQKQYQLADWRQRPLSAEMLRYAREDTHYLLYIYDHLKKELLKSSTDLDNKLKQVFDKSSSLCKKVFKKPSFYSKGFLNLCQNNSHLNSKQLKALNDLYRWRDNISREEDESCEYVLKSFQLLKIAELLPREIYGILALCNPLSHIVQSNVHEMHEIIRNAREFGGVFTLADINGATSALNNSLAISDLNTSLNATKASNILDSIVQPVVSYDPHSILNCAHDFPHQFDQMNDQHDGENHNHVAHDSTALENMFKSNLSDLFISNNEKKKSSFTLPSDFIFIDQVKAKSVFTFKSSQQISSSKNKKLLEKIDEIKKSILNPFEMYLPKELRKNTWANEHFTQWSLIRPSEEKESQQIAQQKVEPAKLDKEVEDLGMIPIKMQMRAEKKVDQTKKLRKAIKKNVDFTDAIVRFNKQKSAINALGAELEESGLVNDAEQFNELSQKIRENLKTLSATVKKTSISQQANQKDAPAAAATAATTTTTSFNAEFKYDTNQMNQMFNGNNRKQQQTFDPASKIKRVGFGKVNKRRQTNAVTRSSNNQSFTFKK